MSVVRSGLVAAVLAGALAAPAIACPPPPPPPVPPAMPVGTPEAEVTANARAWNDAHRALSREQERDRALAQQAGLFDTADSMMIARLDRHGVSSGYPPEVSFMNGQPTAVLTPVRWVKGAGDKDELVLSSSNPMSCGFAPADAALRGAPGDVFLVYLQKTAEGPNSVLFVIPIDRVIEPRALALLTKE